ncbi:hypothetical protein D4765_09790 [Subtercola vilae]|uniref:TetR/AcrR family transcriptional regulator n=1 Tax=Subtercola vilae TaxID=2056433 RepID=A0A4T2BYD3_9MICO|nr:hypothetical protein D4765_09790 [Subtercola vilae]
MHVLHTVQALLRQPHPRPLTFTALAIEAEVSRRTLYLHWSSIEQVIADALQFNRVDYHPADADLPVALRLREYLGNLRDGVHEPVARQLGAALVAAAVTDPSAAAGLNDLTAFRLAEFRTHVGAITDFEYATLTGVIFASEYILQRPVTDEQLDELAARTLVTLRLE